MDHKAGRLQRAGGDSREAEAAPVPAAPLRHSKGDRSCAQCGMKLSLYNPGPNCWQHTIGWPWRGPSARPRY